MFSILDYARLLFGYILSEVVWLSLVGHRHSGVEPGIFSLVDCDDDFGPLAGMTSARSGLCWFLVMPLATLLSIRYRANDQWGKVPSPQERTDLVWCRERFVLEEILEIYITIEIPVNYPPLLIVDSIVDTCLQYFKSHFRKICRMPFCGKKKL